MSEAPHTVMGGLKWWMSATVIVTVLINTVKSSPYNKWSCAEKGTTLTDEDCRGLQRKSDDRCYLDEYDGKWKSCFLTCNGAYRSTQREGRCIIYCNDTMKPGDMSQTSWFTVLYLADNCKFIATPPSPEPTISSAPAVNSTNASLRNITIGYTPKNTQASSNPSKLNRGTIIAVVAGVVVITIVVIIVIVLFCKRKLCFARFRQASKPSEARGSYTAARTSPEDQQEHQV